MKVVHIAGGCVSGSPLRIVRALNKHTQCQASLVNTMKEDPRRLFDIGTCWWSHRDEAVSLIREADIIHAHGLKVLKDLKPFFSPKSSIIFHAHGVFSPCKIQEASSLGAEIVSILQYPERYIPKSRLLPNIVDMEASFNGKQNEIECSRIFYSPTFRPSSWGVGDRSGRWLTKGNHETLAILRRIQARGDLKGSLVDVCYVRDTPFETCMRLKRSSHIVVDDTVTGSYHLVGLESLAMGIPTVGFVDTRMEHILKALTGAEALPWVNTRISNLEECLSALIQDPSLRSAIAEDSCRWMQTYYREDLLIRHFVKAYEDLIHNPETFSRVRFNSSNKKVQWFVRDAYDLAYLSLKNKTQRGFMPDFVRGDLSRNVLSDKRDANRILDLYTVSSSDNLFGSWLYENRHRRIDAQSDLFYCHRREALLAKYRLAASHAQGKDVVDLGSGTGYGAALLKEEGGAASVVGVELDMLAAAYAQEVYAREGITYLEGNVMEAGLPTDSFGLVTAIDLLEWVDCDGALLEECVRLLAPGGTCVISAGDFWSKESEAFYQRRYSPKGFRALLQAFFGSVTLYRQCYQRKMERCVLIPDSGFNVLAEGESLIAVCKL